MDTIYREGPITARQATIHASAMIGPFFRDIDEV